MHRWKDVGHGTSPEVKTLLKGEQTESWAKAGRGSKPPGPPAPVDTHAGVQKGERGSFPSKHGKASPRRKRALADAPGRQHLKLLLAGPWSGLGLSAPPPSGSLGTPCLSDIMDENQAGFPILGLPRPLSPASWTLPKRDLFCQLPFIEL